MRSAVIVSTARTPIGRALSPAPFNNLPSPTLASHSIKAAVERAGVDPAEVDDVIFGCALQQGHQANNIARTALLRAGLPVSVAGMSIDRQCSSGLMAIATAAKQIITDNMDITIGGGVESISLVQTPENELCASIPNSSRCTKTIYMSMLGTAEEWSPNAIISAAMRWTNMPCNRSSAPPHAQVAGCSLRQAKSCRSPPAWRSSAQGNQGDHP